MPSTTPRARARRWLAHLATPTLVAGAVITAPGADTAPGPDLVMTGHGWQPRNHVHRVRPGEHLRHEADDSVTIRDANDRIVSSAAHDAAPTTHSWIVACDWVNPSVNGANVDANAIASFQASWQVPPQPSVQEGQILLLFDGLQNNIFNNSGNTIIQPILQWQDGQWSIYSEYAYDGGFWPTTPIVVQPGQVITGLITQSAQGNGQYTATCSFTNIPNTTLTVSNEAVYTQAVMTLEVYYTNQVSDYPRALFTDFNNLYLSTADGAPANPWSQWIIDGQYGEHIDVFTNSASGGNIGLYYHNGSSRAMADFDGDGRSDVGIYRPSTGTWYVDLSTGGSLVQQYGAANLDLPVPGDWLNNGTSQVAVYRPNTATWYTPINPGGLAYGWGNVDRPIPGRYQSGAGTQYAVFRPTNADWYTPNTPNGQAYGWAGVDVPIPGDYTGGGMAQISVFRPLTDQWFTPATPAGEYFGWANVDVPVPADYLGLGYLQYGVFRPITGQWFVPTGIYSFGATTDIPVPADYLGRGKAQLAVYRPSTGQFFIAGGPIYNCPGGAVQAKDVPLTLPMWYKAHPFN